MSTDEQSAARLRYEGVGLDPEPPASEPATVSRPRPVLASLLIEAGLVTGEQIQAAVVEGARTGARFGEVLLRHGAVSEMDLAHALAEQWGIPFVEHPELSPAAARGLIPPDEAREHGALAIELDDEGRSVVALVDPTRELIERVESELGGPVSFVVVTPTEFERLVDETSAAGDAPIPASPAAAAPVTSPAVTTSRDLPTRDSSPVRSRAHPAEPEGAELLSELERAEGTLQELGTTMESISAAIRAAEEQARALAETRELLAAAEARVAELTDELGAERARTEELAGRTEELAGRTEELTAELESRDELFATLRAKLGELSGALGTGP